MSDTAAPQVLVGPVSRLSYPQLFTPKADDSGKEKYSCVLIFPRVFTAEMYARHGLVLPEALVRKSEERYIAMRKAAEKFAIEFFQGVKNLPPEIKERSLRLKSGWPFNGCEYKPDFPYGPEGQYINVSTVQMPAIVAGKKDSSGKFPRITSADRVYPGCWVIPTISLPYGYNQKGNKGVSFGLRNIQVIADGERLGGGGNPDNEFENVETLDGSGDADLNGDDDPFAE